MTHPIEALRDSVRQQRTALADLLREPLGRLARRCAEVWGDRAALDALLAEALGELPYCKHLYAIDTLARQISDNVGHNGLMEGYGRDRSDRPYLQGAEATEDLHLSEAYISLKEQRPSLTALHAVRDPAGRLLGRVGAYFGLRDLPLTRSLYEEPRQWRQLRGDPSIRRTVFHQNRVDSEMDRQLDTVLGVVGELMRFHGVYHVMLHFSSSRAVIWVASDPFRYRLLGIDELVHPDICLAYPRLPYPADALVPADRIRPVLENFRALRLMDEMFYLRSGTLNLFNGIVGLTFSCDGSHYVPFEEFLSKGEDFWIGAAG